MRCVIDTNILFGAMCHADGNCRQIIRLALKRVITPLIDNALYTEYRDILQRDQLITKTPLNENERNELFDAFLSVCQWVTVYYRWRPNLKDEGDNHLIELAVAGAASCIITQNTKDFAQAELLFPQLKIMRARDFIKTWQER